MIVAKQVADCITCMRALIAVYLVWIGITRNSDTLSLIGWVMIANWTGDILDGRIARRSRRQYHTWIGDKDLEVDMFVSTGLLVYMLQARYVNVWMAVIYLLLWGFYFVQLGHIPSSLGMLFQAPIYGWFIWVALRDAPGAGWSMVIFIAAALILTWPHFPKVIIPGFINGLRNKHNH